MSIFTFTVNCPVTPTPTPTPAPTPCSCDSYILENFGGAPRTVFYLDCRGISRSIGVSPGTPVELCACSVTPETNISISNLGACGSAATNTPTPIPTSTPTPTPSFPPLPPTPPNRTISVYAKLNTIPTWPDAFGTVEKAARFYYNFDNFQTSVSLLGGNIASTSCNLVGTVSVPEGSIFAFGILSWSNNRPVLFNVSTELETTCPVQDITPYEARTIYCGVPTRPGGGAGFVVTGNRSIYITIFTDKILYEYRNRIALPFNGAIYGKWKSELRDILYYCDYNVGFGVTF